MHNFPYDFLLQLIILSFFFVLFRSSLRLPFPGQPYPLLHRYLNFDKFDRHLEIWTVYEDGLSSPYPSFLIPNSFYPLDLHPPLGVSLRTGTMLLNLCAVPFSRFTASLYVLLLPILFLVVVTAKCYP